ncbi:helix-turn-helix domain-containing protein [Streptomyces sp. NBC_00555]|uniref:AraC-like ligand-binding domain-containing protein n=1 Tax=Streptomyces sp. NBC_00555 TaxID=2903662 RepID=UPI00225B546F|nr:helix-turn-helix domain-containing protein [Streptomyces sp. NBC_00555]MCX5014909.1 helix-turn-helix domain-containing protein [Streptomyces sp. NBC_00555]
MLNEMMFRSVDVPAESRFDYWQERMGQTHAPMHLSSDHADDYRATQRVLDLGAVSVWPATFQPLVFRRTPKLIRQSDPEVYHLSLLLRGSGAVTWGKNREVHYSPHDLYWNDSSRPWEIHASGEVITTVGLEIPKALLPLPRGGASRLIGCRVEGREGIGGLLAHFLTELSKDTSAYQPCDGPRLGTVLTDLVAALFAHILSADGSLPPETHRRALALRIQAFIRQHLHDPQLTPAGIAVAHHISTSYLHQIFQAEGATVAAQIRHQRLEAARRDLADPALRTTPIHAIAARWGFPRAADFSRAHRNAYGTTPKDHRHQALQAHASKWAQR